MTISLLSLDQRSGLVRKAAYASSGTAVFLIVLKTFAFFVTGSTSILSSLLDSLLDSGASFLNLIAVRHAMTPADREHRFGHGKAEALAGLGQAAFIIVSALLLIYKAIQDLLHPTAIQNSGWGIAVMLISIGATIFLVRYQKRVIAKTNSTAISADSLHYAGDIWLNGSVAVSLIVSAFLKVPWLDPAFAIGIAFLILYGAGKILLHSAHELLDSELPDDDREKIRGIALATKDVLGTHDLRTRKSGQKIFIELHIELAPKMPLCDTHDIVENVIGKIEAEYPHAEVIIHQDPYGVVERKQEIQ